MGWTPSRALRLVVPLVAGSTPDLVCRLLAEGMRRSLGATVVIENRPGGFGTLGLAEVARAAPDGDVLGYGNVVSMAINGAVLTQQRYVMARDFAPVALVGFVQNVILVRGALAAETLPQRVELMRAAPGRLTHGSPGIATTGHLGFELLRAMTGTEAVHVPYRGSPQLVEALRRGEVAIACDNISSREALRHTGEARALAVTGAQRTPLFPGLPTAAVAALHAAANAALGEAGLAQRFAALGFETVRAPPAALLDLAARERPIWADVVRRSGARLD